MLFNSAEFFVFFAVVYVLYLNMGHRAQNVLLLVASYGFYGWWDWRFTGLMLLSTVINYVCALRIAGAPSPETRKRWLVLTVSAELTILGFFKYFDFFVTSAESLLAGLGVPAHLLHLNLVLPVGLSFYTFKSISYTIDVYRREFEPTRHFLDFALFVSFFPQLVAGPIERARQLLPQVERPRSSLTAEDLHVAAYLIVWGLFKKVIIGDGCAHLVNAVFNNQAAFSGVDYLIAIYAFAIQIYADFSGYSDIAIGIARLLGFRLMTNFNLPYFAVSPSDFWRRWHISLSTWLRDYLYIPLGGSRHGRARTYRNLILTMALGGLWHGARWTMVAWGVYHGVVLALHRFYTECVPGVDDARADRWRILKIVLMFQVVCLGWLLFRAHSLAQVGHMLRAIATDLRVTPWTVPALLTLAQLSWVLIPYQIAQYLRREPLLAVTWRPAAQFAFSLVVLYSTTFYWMLHRSQVSGGLPFIYFQF